MAVLHRALFVADGRWSGGPIVFLRRVTQELHRFGWNCNVIFVGSRRPPEMDDVTAPISVRIAPRCFSWEAVEKKLGALISDSNPNVVVAFATHTVPVAMRYLYRSGRSKARYLDVIQSNIYAEYERVRQNTDVAVAVAAVSGDSVERVRRDIPARAGRAFRIFYPVPCAPDPRACRAGCTSLRIAYVGMLRHHEKRVLDLIPLAADLVAQKIDFSLTIIGDGEDRNDLEQGLCGIPGMARRIRFLGWLPSSEVLAALSSQDILLLVSEVEGQSIAMLEAMGMGVIPVVSDLPGLREAVQDGVRGFVAPVGKPREFALRISRLAQDAELRNRMATAAWQFIQTTHAIDVATKNFAEILETISRLPLPDALAITSNVYPSSRMGYLRVPSLIQSVKRWCFGQQVS